MVALPKAVIEDAEKLAEKVAGLGVAESVDAVVTVLRDHVKRLDRQRRLTALNEIAADFRAKLLHPPVSGEQVQAELYDEFGLPK
jgi:hypothetical protein